MNISLKVSRNTENKPLGLHFLPAKIYEDGRTGVNNYFNSYIRVEQGGILVNAVRGFPLKGEVLKSPPKYKAFVLQESEKYSEDNIIRHLYVTGKFDNLTYWNYDKEPSKADTYKQALQMLNVSEELWTPVFDTEILTEIDRKRNESGGRKLQHEKAIKNFT